jgi:hypothetical protein
MMAQISDYLIVTYERKPGYWRAAVSRKDRPSRLLKNSAAFANVA